MPSSERVNRVVMTGGSSGIGLATAKAFLDEGYEVISLSRRDCPLRSPRLQSICIDLADAAAVKQFIKKLIERSGMQKELRAHQHYEKPSEVRRRARLRKEKAARKAQEL